MHQPDINNRWKEIFFGLNFVLLAFWWMPFGVLAFIWVLSSFINACWVTTYVSAVNRLKIRNVSKYLQINTFLYRLIKTCCNLWFLKKRKTSFCSGVFLPPTENLWWMDFFCCRELKAKIQQSYASSCSVWSISYTCRWFHWFKREIWVRLSSNTLNSPLCNFTH